MQIDYYHFDELSSTNTFAKENLSLFNPSRLSVILAARQTQGRGRLGRSWISLQGNLCMTLVFKSDHTQSIMQLALACCQVLQPHHPQIKWPNDILIQGKKVAGILGEALDGWLLLGIGVNLNAKVDLATSISLAEIAQGAVDVKLFAQELVEAFTQKPDLKMLQQFSFHRPNDPIVLGDVRGNFQGYGEQGELKLLVDGVTQSFFSGEICVD